MIRPIPHPLPSSLPALALIAGLIVPAPAADAHHGFGGRYDRSAPIYLEGRVVSAYFGYPHASLTVRIDPAARPDAAASVPGLPAPGAWRPELGATVEIEFPPVRRFFALEGRVTDGDPVAVVALRNCEPPHQLRGQWIAPAEGPPVVREGRMQEEADGC